MGFAFNPFTGNFDAKGSGGGGSSYIDGEVQNFSALPETLGSPSVDSAYLVREAEGTWLLNRKPAGIYIRTANTGVRASDWTYAGEFPDVFNDANFVLYDNGDSTRNLQFQLSGIDSGATRVLTAPNSSGTIALTAQLTDTQIFTSNGTWTKPAGAKLVHYFIVAGGGGGGSGARRDSVTNAGGGGGGAGGSVSVGWVDATALGATETVTIGAGGAGEPGSRPNNSNGSTGAVGGASSFGPISSTGGNAGGAGTNTTGGGGHGNSANLGAYYGLNMGRGNSGTGGLTANAVAPAAVLGTPGGGGGGGGKQSTTYYNGANGAACGLAIATTAGGTFVANAAGNAGATWVGGYFGTGGGGGSPGTAGEANNGGNGALYGGGGGGGSAALNDAGGVGKGGDGAQGIVIITTYF